MTNEEAKFLLEGYRPNGADAGNLALAEALARAQRDPELRLWFERQQAFDGGIAAKLRELAPPAGLRESILAGTKLGESGARDGRTSRAWWRRGGVIGGAVAMAAALVVMLNVFWVQPGRPIALLPGVDALLKTARADLSGAHPPGRNHTGDLGVFGEWLQNSGTRLSAQTLPVSLSTLRRDGCRSIDIAGHEVFEICFRRETGWYHVYISPRAGFDPASLQAEPMIHEQGKFVAASWADAEFVVVVAGSTGIDALRGIL